MISSCVVCHVSCVVCCRNSQQSFPLSHTSFESESSRQELSNGISNVPIRPSKKELWPFTSWVDDAVFHFDQSISKKQSTTSFILIAVQLCSCKILVVSSAFELEKRKRQSIITNERRTVPHSTHKLALATHNSETINNKPTLPALRRSTFDVRPHTSWDGRTTTTTTTTITSSLTSSIVANSNNGLVDRRIDDRLHQNDQCWTNAGSSGNANNAGAQELRLSTATPAKAEGGAWSGKEARGQGPFLLIWDSNNDNNDKTV